MEENLNFEQQLVKFNNLKKRKFVTKILVVVFMFLTFATYLISPLSRVSNYALKGNYFLNNNEVLSIINVSRNYSLYSIDEKDFESKLNDHPLIKSSDVSVSVLGLKIEIIVFKSSLPACIVTKSFETL